MDGGYADDGQKLVDHIREYYGDPSYIDYVVLTHPDADHASGLATVLNEFSVGRLWMNRPWEHVEELMPRFERYQDRDRLIARLKRDFPKAAELEEIANDKGIAINDAFLGAQIGSSLSCRRAEPPTWISSWTRTRPPFQPARWPHSWKLCLPPYGAKRT